MKVKDRIKIVQGDITSEEVDAIVNAANTDLLLGSGVAGAIRIKGGPTIQAECNRHGPVELGGVAITGGGDLPAKHVLHAAAMHLGGLPTTDSIRDATLNSLRLADEHHLRSIAFPAISTGIFGFPMYRCAQIMLSTVIDYAKGSTGLEKVVFCLYGTEAFEVFARELESLPG